MDAKPQRGGLCSYSYLNASNSRIVRVRVRDYSHCERKMWVPESWIDRGREWEQALLLHCCSPSSLVEIYSWKKNGHEDPQTLACRTQTKSDDDGMAETQKVSETDESGPWKASLDFGQGVRVKQIRRSGRQKVVR